MEIPIAPPSALNYKLGDGYNDAYEIRIPEEAKCSRGCSHVLQWHGRLQSCERRLQRNQRF